MKYMTDIQLALDLTDLDRALSLARKSLKGGATIIEAGTPLIKSVGMESVRSLSSLLGGRVRLVADMKTSDAGYTESEMAAQSGADVTTVLAAYPDAVRETVRAAGDYDISVMADLMESEDIVRTAASMEEVGVDLLCVHSGIDTGVDLASSFEILSKVAGNVSIPVAAAGGLDRLTAPEAVEHGSSIVIVGRAITEAEDAMVATAEIRSAIDLVGS